MRGIKRQFSSEKNLFAIISYDGGAVANLRANELLIVVFMDFLGNVLIFFEFLPLRAYGNRRGKI